MPTRLLLLSLAASVAAFSPAGKLAPQIRAPSVVRGTHVALKELPPSGTKLDDFLQLLGRCYAVAGVAHAADFATANALPAMAAVPPFVSLPLAGQAMGVIWCLIGAVQPLAGDRPSRTALAAAYGIYEIVLTVASGVITSDPDGTAMRLAAAIGVQAVVASCYVVLKQQSIESAEAEQRAAVVSTGGRSGLGRLRMQLSEEEIQAKLEAMGGAPRALGEPRGIEDDVSESAGGGLPPLVGEIGIFAAAILIFVGALVVSLS